ncbi:hypothetical protein V5799_034467 [Amblyomma americanum]|uniref:Uncharacterized protein n=1 Tax=Amblyomma americanum TaxID=6943 RepID=A0AAQ4DKD4_AMBAM
MKQHVLQQFQVSLTVQKLLCRATTSSRLDVNSTGFVPHFVSETCDQKFATQDLFETRRQHEHPEEPPGKYCCTYCSFSSDSK